jgi:hypothetical protein
LQWLFGMPDADCQPDGTTNDRKSDFDSDDGAAQYACEWWELR